MIEKPVEEVPKAYGVEASIVQLRENDVQTGNYDLKTNQQRKEVALKRGASQTDTSLKDTSYVIES